MITLKELLCLNRDWKWDTKLVICEDEEVAMYELKEILLETNLGESRVESFSGNVVYLEER